MEAAIIIYLCHLFTNMHYFLFKYIIHVRITFKVQLHELSAYIDNLSEYWRNNNLIIFPNKTAS